MITKLTVVETESIDVFVNQGIEKALFDAVSDGELILYLWSNLKTVVIGRNQDAQSECKVELLESENGKLARRLSGGGAVFHDLGNVNYTFIAKSNDFCIERQQKIVLSALSELGVYATSSGRNDIEVNGYKIGGSAYYKKDGRELHHGTMLIDSAAEDVSRFLTPSKEKLIRKCVKSVESRVSNLKKFASQVTVELFKLALKNALRSAFPCAEYTEKLPFNLGATAILSGTAFFASDEWRYGKKQNFDLRLPLEFEGIRVEVGLNFENEIIIGAEIFTDSLDIGLSERIKTKLVGMNIKTAKGETAERIRGEFYGV